MALPGYNSLAVALYNMPRTMVQMDGVTNFVNIIGDYMDKVQAGPTGAASILKINRGVMIGILMTQRPVIDKTWVTTFANAWAAAVTQATISPNTVIDPSWDYSNSKDSLTKTSGAATISNISACRSILITRLNNVQPVMGHPYEIAIAIHDATKAMLFTCIGVANRSPLPKQFPAL